MLCNKQQLREFEQFAGITDELDVLVQKARDLGMSEERFVATPRATYQHYVNLETGAYDQE
jgi:hypothetical protein